MNAHRASVVMVLPDKMGGVLSVMSNLLAHREPDAFAYHAIRTHNHLSVDTRSAERLAADSDRVVEYRLPVENLHAVIRRVQQALPAGDGVLLTNDLLELAVASAVDLGRTVMMMVHGDYDYYYDLAARHDDVVDVFICVGRVIQNKLRARLPHRAESILHQPYGIPLPARMRAGSSGALRLLFVGRLDEQKGVFDLPAIDAVLRAAGVAVTWTIVGAGPCAADMRERWGAAAHVRLLGAQPQARVLEIAADHDVFVLPTRAEGFPVSLLEAMAVGLVPVVSNLESGVRELVDDGVHGFTPAVGDVAGFANAIRALHLDRARLEAASAASCARARRDYDIRDRVRDYQRLFARHHDLRRPRSAAARLPYGSRLDRAWIPNTAVRIMRTIMRRSAGQPV